MQLVDLSKPGEKKKLIVAAVLGLIAIVFLWWTLIGFGSGTPTPPAPRAGASPAPPRGPQTTTPGASNTPSSPDNWAAFTEIKFVGSSYNAPEARRNIFAYYVPPPPPAQPVETSTPTPPPPPPVLLASVSPSNVYARTADFKLEVAGDKFTPAMRIYVDGRELATSYQRPQQLSATVAASMIANPGTRNVMVRTPDNQLFSNPLSINVAAAPTPNYTYIGIIGRPNRVDDIALVQERNNKNIINVLRGDVLSGRFRVTSISDKELVLVDTTLKIKHTISMSEGDKGIAGPLARPTPRVDAEDDEP
jgi:hypothetical protein